MFHKVKCTQMNRTLYIICCLLGMVSVSAVGQQTIFVSPEGDDRNSGSAGESVRSFDKAMMLAKDKLVHGPVEILLSEGEYQLSRPVEIDSTWQLSKNNSLVVRGAGIGKTVVSGGLRLPPFEAVNDSLWIVDLAGTPYAIAGIGHLFVNGQRAVLARTPDAGSMFRKYEATEFAIDSVPVRGAVRDGLFVQRVKLPASAYDAMRAIDGRSENVRVSFLHAWDMTRRQVETFSPADSAIFVIGNPMKPWNPIDREAQLFFENDRSFLDKPGEWFFDSEQCRLYYIPLKNEICETSVAVVPVADRFLIINGGDNNPVNNVMFSGVTFAYTNYRYSRRGNDPVQAAARVDASFHIKNASGIDFLNCEIVHTGDGAIWFDDGSRNCSVVQCYFHDLGAGAVKMGNIKIPDDERLVRFINVDNNIFHSGGRVFPTAVGVLATHAADVTISNNDIADFYYSGISIGWVWGYSHSPSKRNMILYNKVHHIGRGMLSDMGGIYTLGPSEGTIISNNIVTDIYSYSYGGWGIYTDEGSSGILIRNNLVYNCKSSGFHQHYGRDNVIKNNIFANQMYAQLEATEIENHLSFTFTNNIVYYNKGDMYGIKWDSVNSVVDNNAYWCSGSEPLKFNDYTFKQWKQHTGHDVHSIIADPRFVDVEAGNFIPTNKTLIRKIDFEPFDSSLAGVYGDSTWTTKAILPSEIIKDFDRIVNAYESVPDCDKPKKMNVKK